MNDNAEKRKPETGSGSRLHAAVMFFAAVLFLAVLAVVVQWWNSSKTIEPDTSFTVRLLALIWAPFVAEALVGLVLNNGLKGNLGRFFLITLVPPFRMGYSTFADAGRIWLPGLGERFKDRELFEQLERLSAMPMLIIALMILPLLGIEFLPLAGIDVLSDLAWLGVVLDACFAFIWFSFALEFIIMVSVVEEKIAYSKKNWLNLLIILMPLLAFMRGFQVVRVFRAARAGKLLRVYRLRGLLIRLYQALVALSAIERLLYRNPEKHLGKLEKLHDEKERELAALREKIEEVRDRIAESQAQRTAGDSLDS